MRALCAFVVSVGRQPGKLRFAARLFEHFETEVVLVIADGHRIVVERVHHQHHRIDAHVVLAAVERFQRRALNRVAGIDEHDVWLVFAHAVDESRDLGEAAVVGFVGVVVDRIDVAVQVRRAEDRDLHSFGRKAMAGENDCE